MKKAKKLLCVGAVAAASVLPLSGCNLLKANFSDEQVEQLMSALEKTNNKFNLEEAYKLFELAQISFSSNFNGVRDNLTLVKTIGDKTTTEYYWNVPMGDYFFVSLDKVDDDTFATVIYRLNGKVYKYENDNGSKNKEEITDCETVNAYLTNSLHFDTLNGINLEKEHLLKSEVLENGNYNIIFGIEATGSGDSKIIFQYEITPDAKFVSSSSNNFTFYEDNGVKKVMSQVIKTTYTYGAVTEEIMSGHVSEAKSFQP